jgi:hypothetical protein
MMFRDPLADFVRVFSDEVLDRLLAEADELMHDSVVNRADLNTWPVERAVRVTVVRDYLRKEKARREQERSRS